MLEQWKPVNGLPMYEVSSFGRVRRISRPPYRVGIGRAKIGVLRGGIGKQGYRKVTLRSSPTHKVVGVVHRLVAQHFLSNPSLKPQVNHLDGDKVNNNVDNLTWATNRENARHAASLGLLPTKHQSKPRLAREVVREIRRHFKGRYGELTHLAKKYGVTRNCVRNIVNHVAWKYI